MKSEPKSSPFALIISCALLAMFSLTQPVFSQGSQPPPWPADKPISETNEVADGVYSFRFRGHRTMFITTDEGIIVTDPINERAAPKLMAAIRAVSDKPIKYMIYSHEHRDHVSGGQIFKDAGATVIAQEKCVGALKKNPKAVAPDETFSDSKTITLGDKTVELSYLGPNHGNCLTVMHLPEQRLLFTVDIVTPKSVMFRDLRGDFFASLATLKKLQKMDIDRIMPGHGVPVAPASAIDGMIGYMEDLSSKVKVAMETHQELEAIKKAVDLSKYQNWRNADRFLMMNIEGMVRIHKAMQ